MSDSGPTHFRCQAESCLADGGRFPLAQHDDHMAVEHGGRVQAVELIESRCSHGKPTDKWCFGCDYDPW